MVVVVVVVVVVDGGGVAVVVAAVVVVVSDDDDAAAAAVIFAVEKGRARIDMEQRRSTSETSVRLEHSAGARRAFIVAIVQDTC